MNEQAKLAALLDLAEELGLPVRACPVGHDGAGSVVRLKGKEIIFLDDSASMEDQIELLRSALAGRDELNQRFIPPEVRQLLEGSP